jgi:hypothetical protein
LPSGKQTDMGGGGLRMNLLPPGCVGKQYGSGCIQANNSSCPSLSNRVAAAALTPRLTSNRRRNLVASSLKISRSTAQERRVRSECRYKRATLKIEQVACKRRTGINSARFILPVRNDPPFGCGSKKPASVAPDSPPLETHHSCSVDGNLEAWWRRGCCYQLAPTSIVQQQAKHPEFCIPVKYVTHSHWSSLSLPLLVKL